TEEAPASDTSTVNPVRPLADGVCQVATYATSRVNVRVAPSLNAEVVAFLDPAVLYQVYMILVAEGETWYQVQAGWVASLAVVIGGNCANVPTLNDSAAPANNPDLPL